MNRFDLGPWWVVSAVAVLDRSATARALLRGHGVNSTLAWICAVLAFPGLGAVAYLSLANPSVRRTVRKRASVALATPDVTQPCPATRDDMGLFHLATSLTGVAPTTGNRVDLLVEEVGAFERIQTRVGTG